MRGLVGLVAFAGLFAVPLFMFSWNHGRAVWGQPAFAPAAAIATIVLLTFLNNLPNSTINPVIALAAGGIVAANLSRSVLTSCCMVSAGSGGSGIRRAHAAVTAESAFNNPVSH